LCTIVAAAYACIDEYSQFMPGLNRTAALDDLVANLAGVTLAAAMSVVAARVLPGGEPAAGQSPHA
jgi:VanZ family protein